MQSALVLFTKVPAPGRVKTRLTNAGRVLCAEGAAQLYADVLRDVFDLSSSVAELQGARLYVAFTPSDGRESLREILGAKSQVSFLPQEGNTIAEKIANAVGWSIDDGNDIAVVVFGDHPGLNTGALNEALKSLACARGRGEPLLVIGPTCDGGTYLIGVTKDLRAWLGRTIDCTESSKAVSKFLVKARRDHIGCVLLDVGFDLDDPLDLWLLKKRTLATSSRTMRALRSIRLSGPPLPTFDLSVIIPTLDEGQTLEKTLLSLRAQRGPRTEIVVVDGGSKDRTLEIANRYADRVVNVRRPGRQRQENMGAQGAKGAALLFLHADTKPSPQLLNTVAEALNDELVVGGGAHLHYFPDRFRYRVLCALREAVSRLLGIHGMGSSFFVRRDAFDCIGGFDERMNEEGVDMSKKLRRIGRMIMISESVGTSARRFETLGFFRTVLAWAMTVALSYFGVRAVSIERHVWRVVR